MYTSAAADLFDSRPKHYNEGTSSFKCCYSDWRNNVPTLELVLTLKLFLVSQGILITIVMVWLKNSLYFCIASTPWPTHSCVPYAAA